VADLKLGPLPGKARSDRMKQRLAESKPPIIPPGSWPRRMSAAVAAGYCGEESVVAFMKRVGSEYPHPRVNDDGANYGFATTSIKRSCRPQVKT
jgi:hypothetical protein